METRKPKESYHSVSITPEATDKKVGAQEPGPRRQRPGKRRRKKRSMTGLGLLVGLVLGCVALYFFAAVVLVPYLVRSWLPGQLSSQWQRKVVVESATFDPFSGRLTLERGSIGPESHTGTDHIDIFTFSRLTVDLESASFFKGGFIAREIVLEDPVVRIVRNKDKSTNFAHLAPALTGNNLLLFVSGGAKIFGLGYSLNNISCRNGLITLDDRLSEKTHEAKGVQIDLPAIASISYPIKTYLPPRFSAQVNGSPLEIEGVVVEGEVLESRMHLKGDHIDLPSYLDYFSVAGMVALKKGWADCDLTIHISFVRETGMRLLVAGAVNLQELEFADEKGGRAVHIEGMELLLRAEPLARKYQVEKVSVIKPEISLVREENGKISVSEVVFLPLTALGSGVVVDGGVVEGGRIFFLDQAVAGGFNDIIENISLKFDSAGDGDEHVVTMTGNGTSRTQATIEVKGLFEPVASRFEGDIAVDDVALTALEPYWADLFANGRDFAVKNGRAQFSGRLHISGKTWDVVLQQGAAVFNDLMISSGEHDIVRAPKMMLNGITFSPGNKHLGIDSIEGDGVWFSFSRDSAGRWYGPGMWKKLEEQGGGVSGVWDVDLSRLVFRESTVQVTLAPESPASPGIPLVQTYEATSVFLEYGPEGEDPVTGRVTGKGMLPGNGSFSIAGPIQVKPYFSAELECTLQDLDLTSYQSFFSSWFTPEITSGTVAVKGVLHLPNAMFSGQAGVSRFSTTGLLGGSQEKHQIIQWHDATATEVEARFAPFVVRIGMLSVEQPYFFWIGAGSGTTGFSTFFIGRDFLEDISGEPRVRIKTTRIDKGILDYTEPGSPPYSFSVTDIDGELTGIESNAENRARFSLQGLVAAHAPLSLDGTAGFFDKGGAFSFKSRLDSLKLGSFSAHLASSLGVRVKSGELTMASEYQRQNGRVTAANSLDVKNLVLEEHPDRNLPLVVALLKDENATIRLEEVLDGSVTDQDLSIQKSLGKKVRNLVGTTTVAPFSMVQGLFPDGKPVEQVSFAFGSAELNGKIREDLKSLAAMLARRPGLALVLHGSADDTSDRNAIIVARKKKAKLLEQAAAAVRQSAAPIGKNDEKAGGVPENTPPAAPPPAPPPVDRRDLVKLAEERSLRVAHYLVEDLRVDAQRIRVREEMEIVPARSSGRSGNRVRFILDGH